MSDTLDCPLGTCDFVSELDTPDARLEEVREHLRWSHISQQEYGDFPDGVSFAFAMMMMGALSMDDVAGLVNREMSESFDNAWKLNASPVFPWWPRQAWHFFSTGWAYFFGLVEGIALAYFHQPWGAVAGAVAITLAAGVSWVAHTRWVRRKRRQRSEELERGAAEAAEKLAATDPRSAEPQ